MGLDIIIQLARDEHMRRYVKEITEVDRFDRGTVVLNPLFVKGRQAGELNTKAYKTEKGVRK